MSLLMSWSRSPGFAAEFVIGRREDACSCRGRRWRNDRGKRGPAVANMLQRWVSHLRARPNARLPGQNTGWLYNDMLGTARGDPAV
jgi:hypothetical protein